MIATNFPICIVDGKIPQLNFTDKNGKKIKNGDMIRLTVKDLLPREDGTPRRRTGYAFPLTENKMTMVYFDNGVLVHNGVVWEDDGEPCWDCEVVDQE